MSTRPGDDTPRTVYLPGQRGGPAGHWATYTEDARKIAAILREERAQTGRRAASARDGQAGVDRLTHRLAAQRQHLTQLATTLRLPAPAFGAAMPSPVADPAEALRRATLAADSADEAAQTAYRRASEPPLLPSLTPLARNASVYAAAALLGTIVSVLVFFASPETELGSIPWHLVPWSLCGFPALAFFAGYLTISLAGQPRIGEQGTKSARAGGAICFVGMPILWFIFIAATRG